MGHSERTKLNPSKELKSISFYGVSECKKAGKHYVTPAERKSLREKGKLIGLEMQKFLIGGQNSVKKITKPINADGVSKSFATLPKSGSSGAFNFSDVSIMKSRSAEKIKSCNTKPSSPTINWAPSSLGKRRPLSNFSWKQLKLPNPSANNMRKCEGKDRLKCQSKRLSKENTPPVPHEVCAKVRAVAVKNSSNENIIPHCVKELKYDQCTVVVTKLPTSIKEKSDEHLKLIKNKDETDTKLYPIFYSKASPMTSSATKSKVLNSQETKPATISPQALHLSLSSIPKTRQASSPSTSPKNQQMIIDAGQKKFGATQCNMCGMVYTVNHPSDQQHHSIYHKRFLTCVKFTGWKKENEVASFVDGRILKVLPNDPKYALKKVSDIRSLIDIDLGFDQTKTVITNMPKVTYLFISTDNQIAGCLVTEPIAHAYRLLPSNESKSIVSCSLQPEQVSCGVSRIWTYYPYRRSGIATRLMDTLRNTFMMGCQLETYQVAFSDPTPDGIRFASHYCSTPEFLTYNLHH